MFEFLTLYTNDNRSMIMGVGDIDSMVININLTTLIICKNDKRWGYRE